MMKINIEESIVNEPLLSGNIYVRISVQVKIFIFWSVAMRCSQMYLLITGYVHVMHVTCIRLYLIVNGYFF